MTDVQASQTISLTQNRRFRRLWGAQFAAVAAVYALNFAALVAVAERTLSVTQTGLVILSSITPAFLGSLISGVVVDRFDRIRVLKISHLVRALVMVIFCLAATDLPDAVGVPLIYATLVIGAFATQFATPAELSILPDIVNDDQLIRANSLLQTSTLVAEGIGIVLIGPLLSKVAGPGAVGLLNAGLLLIAFGLIFGLPAGRVAQDTRGLDGMRDIQQELRAGWMAIVRDRVLRMVTLQITLASVLLLILLSTLPALAAIHLDIQVTDVSFLMVPGGIGFGVGALLVGRLGNRLAAHYWISGGLIVLGCAIAGMVWLTGGQGIFYLILLLVAIFTLGLALALAIIPARAVIQSRPAPELRGRVIAAQLMLANLLAVVPLLVGGMVADQLGVRPVMLVLAFLALGSGAAGWRQPQA